MTTNDFAAFLDSYFGDPYMAWHDGLDEEALLRLTGDERAEAERLLIAALPSGDSRVAAGLKALRSPGAAPLLKARLAAVSGDEAVQTALALWRIEHYPPAQEKLIDVLRHNPWWGVRLNAARELRHVRTPQAVAALVAAVQDEDPLVRHHAVESLLAMHGIPEPDGRDKLSIAIMSGVAAERRQTIARVMRRIARATLQEE